MGFMIDHPEKVLRGNTFFSDEHSLSFVHFTFRRKESYFLRGGMDRNAHFAGSI